MPTYLFIYLFGVYKQLQSASHYHKINYDRVTKFPKQ